jgi:hypothetical protein
MYYVLSFRGLADVVGEVLGMIGDSSVSRGVFTNSSIATHRLNNARSGN